MRLAAEYPVSLACGILGYPRSSYYYQAREPDDQALQEALTQVAATWPTYGYRRITIQLRREGWRVNSKRVRRIMGELGFRGKVYWKKRRTTNSDHPFPRYPNLVQGLAVVRPDMGWGYYLREAASGVCLSGGAAGRVYPMYPRLALGA